MRAGTIAWTALLIGIAAWPAASVARLGESPSACDARYGAAVRSGDLREGLAWRQYRKSGYTVTVLFCPQAAGPAAGCLVVYRKERAGAFGTVRDEPLGETERESLLKTSGDRWQRYEDDPKLKRPGQAKGKMPTGTGSITWGRAEKGMGLISRIVPHVDPGRSSSRGAQHVAHNGSGVFAYLLGARLVIVSADAFEALDRCVAAEDAAAAEKKTSAGTKPPEGL